MKSENLTYPPNLFSEWKEGNLSPQWMRECPALFSFRDYEIIRNQTQDGYHFGEWFVAKHYWEQGYGVLIEKYAFRSHPVALSIAERILGSEGLAFLRSRRLACQPPDLLVYASDTRPFFFVEVKRHPDRVRESQRRFFEQLEVHFGCEVVIVALCPERQQ